jgi:hypothetical protein
MPRKTLIQHRRDTQSNWTAVNPVLALGEFGVESDTNKFKIGDGVTAWQSLSYQGGAGVPSGGSANQILTKLSSTDYDVAWVDASGVTTAASQVKHIVKNSTGSTLTKGTVVYTAGANGTNILVDKALATTDQFSAQTLGFLEQDLANNATGYVVTSGLVTGVNTSGTNPGEPIWLSSTTAGGVVFGLSNKPQAPNHLVYMGVVTKKSTNGEVFVHISNGWELDELHNVKITSVQDNDILVYDSTTEVWQNQQLSATTGIAFSSSHSGTTWNVTHNLGYRPSVTTTDNALTPNVIEGTVVHIDANSLTVTFTTNVGGTVYLS